MSSQHPYWFAGTIRVTAAGEKVRLACKTATALHFGWIEAFGHRADYSRPGGGDLAAHLSPWPRRGRIPKGRPMRICLSTSKHGHPAGETFRFRISRRGTLLDVVHLAANTTADWEWIELSSGRRLNREQLLEMHQSIHRWSAAPGPGPRLLAA